MKIDIDRIERELSKEYGAYRSSNCIESGITELIVAKVFEQLAEAVEKVKKEFSDVSG